MIIKQYKIARGRGGASLKGPFFPRQSFRIMKRTVRGMLPYTQARGLEALKRVICYDDVPKEFENAKKITLRREINASTLKLHEVSKEL